MKKTVIPPTPAMPRVQTVVGYGRVSSGKDAMLHSLAAQVSYYSDLIQKTPGWRYGGVYSDEARTGTKDTRPEFQRMLQDCRAGRIDLILTKSISRFARNTLVLLETVRELRSLDIGIWFEEEKIDTLSKDGELMLTILAAYAQDESRAVSANMKWRIQKKFEQGFATQNSILGYRLVDGIYHVEPEEAAIVKLIYSSCLNGMGTIAIGKMLDELGIITRFGNGWCRNAIFRILRNEKYTGLLILQKTYVEDHITKRQQINRGQRTQYVVENAHEAIIPKAVFDRVQTELKRRHEHFLPPSAPRPKPYPYSSLIQCGCCEKNYRRKITGYNQYRRPVWICNTFNVYGKQACASQQIPERILDEKTKAVLGVSEINIPLLREKIERIIAHNGGMMTYILRSGESIDVHWENASRRDSWNADMRNKAREQKIALKRGADQGGKEAHRELSSTPDERCERFAGQEKGRCQP